MKYEVTSSSAGVNARYGTVSDTGEICMARWNNTELPALMSALVTATVNRRLSSERTASANSPSLPKNASAENSINAFVVSGSATSSTLLANRFAPCLLPVAIRQIANVPAPGQFSTIDGNNNDEDDDVFEGGEAIERAVLIAPGNQRM